MAVLEVDYEMNGKDLIESYTFLVESIKLLGEPLLLILPTNFLDEKGEKISKSIGNGISVEDWLKFSPKESLNCLCFKT